MDDLDFSRYEIKEQGTSVRTQLWIIVIIVASLLLGYLVYINVNWHKTGKMKEAIRAAKKDKRNKGYWNASEVG
jgi:hypothetical protein